MSFLFLFSLLLAASAFAATTSHSSSPASSSAVPDNRLMPSEDFGLQYQQNGKTVSAPLVSTQVSMSVAGLINRVTVQQTFTNPSHDWIHGRYVFPLPQNAAVDRLRLYIGDRFIEGDIKPKAVARKQYQQAKTEGKKASLVEQHRPNIFSTEVANVAPGETVKVEIEYQQTLTYRDGEFSLVFPTVVTPRYIPGVPIVGLDDQLSSDNAFGQGESTAHDADNSSSDNTILENVEKTGNSQSIVTTMPSLSKGWGQNTDQVPDANNITPYYRDPALAHLPGGAALPFSIDIDLDAGLPLAWLKSPSFNIVSKEISSGHYNITLANPDIADRDFILNWRPMPASQPQAAFFYQPASDNGKQYGLLMALPPQAVSRHSQAAKQTSLQKPLQTPMAKEVTFVLDVSGSMHGEPIIQAKRALLYGLRKLSVHDTFNLVLFNNNSWSYSEAPLPATEQNLRDVERMIRGLNADGGTEMSSALDRAMRRQPSEHRLGQVVFITDAVSVMKVRCSNKFSLHWVAGDYSLSALVLRLIAILWSVQPSRVKALTPISATMTVSTARCANCLTAFLRLRCAILC
ncbi:VIT domain-containing protein [Veronia nyctiphanis]|nr:VIT domain-containing protein [Veronia nyctiphanis]